MHAEFSAVQTSASTFLEVVSASSPAQAMQFGLMVEGKQLMSRFFQESDLCCCGCNHQIQTAHTKSKQQTNVRCHRSGVRLAGDTT